MQTIHFKPLHIHLSSSTVTYRGMYSKAMCLPGILLLFSVLVLQQPSDAVAGWAA